MKNSNNDESVVAKFADHDVITPPHKLRKAVATAAAPVEDPVARAEQALEQLAGEFEAWMEAEISRLDSARQQVRKGGFTPKNREALFHAAHDIKGQAATFGFPEAAGVADSLCRLIEHTPEVGRIPLNLVDQHVDAVRAIVRESDGYTVSVTASNLTRRLCEVTDEFLVRENRHRPEYLEGIVAPPLAPRG